MARSTMLATASVAMAFAMATSVSASPASAARAAAYSAPRAAKRSMALWPSMAWTCSRSPSGTPVRCGRRACSSA